MHIRRYGVAFARYERQALADEAQPVLLMRKSTIMGRLLPNVFGKTEASFPSVAEALKASGLDFTVTKHPLFARIPLHESVRNEGGGEHGVFKRADNLWGVVRDDTRTTLGVASARYEIIQNREGFGPLDALARNGRVVLSCAAALDGGARIYVQAKTEKPVRVGGDMIDYYVVGRLTHDGSGSVGYFDTPVRLACTNQLRSIIRGAGTRGVCFTVRHTASAGDKIRQAQELLRRVYRNQAAFVRTAEQLLGASFSRREMENLVRTLVPPPDESDPQTTTRMKRSWDERFAAIMRDAYEARDLDDVRYTKWGALNAIADFEQHLVPVKGDRDARADTLARRAFEQGPLALKAAELLLPA